ncbi:MAG: MBL fold metallo-hydrolase [Clostridia bacterium]|nr:MBL fold metallo-hydrolase [Clostridia bacterium]
MHRFFAALFAVLILLSLLGAFAEDAPVQRVFMKEDAKPFEEGEELLHFYVCPLLGADSMILVQGDDVLLVDMGKANQYETIKGVLGDLGITHIKYAFNTHPHDDHLGSMKYLINDFTFDTFMTAFPDNYTGDSVIQRSTLKLINEKNIPVERVDDGSTFTLGNAKLTVIRQTKYKSPNPLSCMLMVEYGDCKMLLTADVIGSAQQLLADTKDLDADVLKFPHHGLNKVIADFLSDISPEYTVFTHGYSNTKDAQKQLQKAGIPYDFATWGLIHLSTNGEYWIVEQHLTEDGLRYEEKYMK